MRVCASIPLFVIRHAQRMRRIMLSFLDCLIVLYFSHYLLKGAICGKSLLNVKYVFKFSPRLLSETFLVLRRIRLDIIVNVQRSSCKVHVILVRF